MSKKNIYILKTLILLCLTAAPSFYILSTPPGQRRPGEASNRARQVPVVPAPAQSAQVPMPIAEPIVQTQPSFAKAMTDKQIKEAPAPAEKKDLQKAEEQEESLETLEESKAKIATVAAARNVQAAAAPGWLANASAMAAQIILLSLDKAIGGGIAAGTKTAIKQFMTRNAFINLKNEVQKEATEIVESGNFDNLVEQSVSNYILKKGLKKDSPEYMQKIEEAQALITLPKQKKIALQTDEIFKQNKIDDPKGMEKATSFSSVLGNIAQTFIWHAIISTVGTIATYGATLSIQSLMPAQQR
jgi:hypothetical protein